MWNSIWNDASKNDISKIGEINLLNNIFDDEPFWKEKYPISWCGHCNTAIITCPKCSNTTCNAGGCDACHDVFTEFHKCKLTVEEYLTKEERKIYGKCLVIQDFILETLAQGKSKINFKQLQKDGKLSIHTEDLLAKELKKK